jgi:hypothetical protein
MTTMGTQDMPLVQHMIPSRIISSWDLPFHQGFLSGTRSGSSRLIIGPHKAQMLPIGMLKEATMTQNSIPTLLELLQRTPDKFTAA